MRIIYTKHAKEKQIERDIKEEDIIDTLEFPDYTIKRKNKEIEAYKNINNKILKVVHVRKENYIKVITIYNLP